MIKIKDLTKRYGRTVIFEHAEYTFPNRGLICLLGASGSGKSTLLNLLAGFDSDYSGEIMINDLPLHTLKTKALCSYRHSHIGFIFQDHHLLHGYSVLENVLLSSELRGGKNHNDQAKAEMLLDRFDLSQMQNKKIENLSGGQKQRAAIARALIGNPEIVLADEPTGALDRDNATEIMLMLKEIAEEKLVIVITHDKKICKYADEVISLEDGKIVCNTENSNDKEADEASEIILTPAKKVSTWRRGFKNIRVHLKRYTAISFAISLGIFCFVLSLTFSNIMTQSIDDFKDKNTAFNNGYIKTENKKSDDIFNILKSDQRIEHVYRQYKLNKVSLKIDNKSEVMEELYPTAKAVENMSYGVMPKRGQRQIALSPSLAKKFADDFQNIIGKEVVLNYNGKEHPLKISGIFNAGYDQLFISSDVEEELYQKMQGESYAISYDVTNFDDIVPVHDALKDKAITAVTSAKEVAAFQSTFQTIHRLFFIVSCLVLFIAVFISSILLVKQQRSRYREIGLLSALGFDKKTIQRVIINENILMSLIASSLNVVWIGIVYIVSTILKMPFILTITQIISAFGLTFLILIMISFLASRKLIHTEPAIALRK